MIYTKILLKFQKQIDLTVESSLYWNIRFIKKKKSVYLIIYRIVILFDNY